MNQTVYLQKQLDNTKHNQHNQSILANVSETATYNVYHTYATLNWWVTDYNT